MNYLLEYIEKRTRKYNKNFLCCACGSTGSGKSYLCLKLATILSSRFSIKHIVFSAQEFMELMTSGELKRGDVILWEEGGVSIGARDFMTQVNKAITYFLQSFRKKNLILFITIPDLYMLDVSVRKLLHGLIVTQSIDYGKNLCKTKFFHVSYSTRSRKVYYKYPRIVRHGKVVCLDRINFGLPDKSLIRKYEAKKTRFLKRLGESVLGKVSPEAKPLKKRMTDEECLDILKEKKGKVTIARIRALTGISEPRARVIKAKIE